ncbi:oxygen-dependent protoporphyrinogen oxidase [Granulicella rosea]|uniref:Coproporphyrinogen III oxidase n=1 Tax=Granulicella rosea TaxID=474952 RepID=A0A239MCR3_9BACT|nr:protoporphyrinogen oxidase [Granulicella rosea]SNT40525.1 oxygen-dependent protoporphyrinogen oxidase [Granulicella rosea]
MVNTSRRTAIVGGGVAGVTAAWQLARHGAAFTLFESRARLGGTVETVRRDGFTVECGPDGWVTEKPWARALAEELGLGDELIASNDATRKTYIATAGGLVAMPDGMRMMVPTDLASLDASELFSADAKSAYARELASAGTLKADAPDADESVASFVLRHFGAEVLAKIGAPLLGGVFGGDVHTLSVQAVMANFVALERQHGSLIAGLQARLAAAPAGRKPASIFTSLRGGTGMLIDRMAASIPGEDVRLTTPVTAIFRRDGGWIVATASGEEAYDALFLATPAHVASELLRPLDPRMAELTIMEASSAVVAAIAFDEHFDLPPGFGFLAPEGQGSQLLAGTFVDQKFPHRAPEGRRLLRAFFGSAAADRLALLPDDEIAALALDELEKIVGRLPAPAFSVVRRWPKSLPQYAVGHLERMAGLATRVAAQPGLWLLGNGYRGVGLPDLIRDARAAADAVAG